MPASAPALTIAEFEKSATKPERALIAHCRAGTPCTLGDGSLPTETPDPARQIRATLIRLLAMGGTADCGLHPSGVVLAGAQITGTLNLQFTKTRGRCVLANCRFDAEPQLAQAEFAQLSLRGSHLPGLSAQGLIVTGSLFLRSLTATKTLDLNSAKIGGTLDCDGATLSGTLDADGKHGIALNAQAVEVTGDLFLTTLTATGTIFLSGAKIGGQLNCKGAALNGAGSDALNAQRLHVAEGLLFRDLKSVKGRVYLDAAHVGALADDAGSWPNSPDDLYLNGFTYDRIGGSAPLTFAARKDWLARGSRFKDHFFPQPYTQFAKVLREMGHAAEARKVLFAREEALAQASWNQSQIAYNLARNGDQSSRADMGWIFWDMWRARIWSGIIRRIAGYGYRPQLPLYWLLGLIGLTFFLALWAWTEGSFAPNSDVVITSKGWTDIAAKDCLPEPIQGCDGNPAETWSAKGAAGTDWDSFNAFGYAADLVIPILDLGQTEAWAPSKDRGAWGWLLWWGRWVLAAAGWIITALGAAAVTGIIQRDKE